tara:strand:+ start:238 stop:1386 length:1149 start_codon:yes stop_codon:yes gene_type:complete
MSFKVLQVIPKLGYGGAETGCYDIAHYLAEKNCKSYIITSGGPLLKFIKSHKVKVIRLPVHSKNPILILFNTILISIILIILRIDIVHARSRGPAWSCLLSCKLTRTKFVTTFHGIYNFSNNIKKFYNSVMVRSDLIIAGSNYVFDHIQKNYGNLVNNKKKLLVIFRGINTGYFDNSNITTDKVKSFYSIMNINSEKIKILLPGRLTKWKGQEMFIESLNLLKTVYNRGDFQVIILGSHQGRKVYFKKLMSMVDKYGLKKDVFFLHHYKEMPVVYYISDIVVSASIEPEAFGRISVEAQSMRRPIIASNHGGSKETIINEKTGFFFENNKPDSLAKKLNKLMEMDKDKLQSIGNEGRKNVLTKFDVEKMCYSTFLEYNKLIK